ncbi:unnamed protein product [Candidula unifasciata]|uniref:Uncharacterized protein n=1 Tax=Candidula unifasciata TaxID=100452 RepID=A0A8S3YMT7_9EUPU|nr:unnamed protein product [Candidula unifasciata]
MYARLVCSCLWIQSVLTLADSNLHSKFKEFDELAPDNFTVVVKRNVVSGQVNMKIVTFSALRKYFVLHLVPGSPVLRKDFQAHMVDGDGRITPVHVDQQIFYTGYLNGNPQHSVDAVHTDDVWIAQIHSPDDVYSIEPLTHHVPDSPATLMLIFKQRDFNSSIFNGYSHENATLQPFCEEVQYKQHPLSDSLAVKQRSHIKNNTLTKSNPYTRNITNSDSHVGHPLTNSIYWDNFNSETYLSIDNQFKIQYKEYEDRWRRSNTKRDTPVYDTCEMLVIADFETYRGMGRSNILRMISILVYLYQSVDRIYRDTIFDSFTNLGIVIAGLIVHTEYTNISNHYNMPNNRMTIGNTLFSLFRVKNLTNYCLAHLTTQRNFAGTMGTATTGSPNARLWGNGICAGTVSDARNVGLSTPMFSENLVLPVARYLLVLAHEIGHNWGSIHDPEDNPLCNPSSQNGEAYMMSAIAALAASPNARTFSPCSRQQIANVLNVKAHFCFKPRSLAEEVCGNNIVEPEEDCDAGYLMNDPCCIKRCRFKDKAVCSPFNHPCCTNSCQIAPPSQKCFVDIQDCLEDAFCSGTESHTCPEPQPLPNDSPCQSLGRCWHGKCVSFCERLGFSYEPTRRLLDCSCDEDRTTMCEHCCMDVGNEQGCTKMGGSKIDGTPCLRGVCVKGVCVDRQMDDTFVDVEKAVYSNGSKDAQEPGRLDDVLLFGTAVCLGWLMAIL